MDQGNRMPNISYEDIHNDCLRVASKNKATVLSRFFKTGKGEYGEGDMFLGIVVPAIRRLVTKYRECCDMVMLDCMNSHYHEERLLGLLLIVYKYEHGSDTVKQRYYRMYCAKTDRINNWDLVDLTASHIVGEYAYRKKYFDDIRKLVRSPLLWERRIGMIATLYPITHGESKLTYECARVLLGDTHDLMHKAVGWMLREAGKRVSEEELITFLAETAPVMPRTMLRYAIERLPKHDKERFMKIPTKVTRRRRV